MIRMTDVVKNLVIINVIVFFGTMAISPDLKAMLGLHYPASSDFQPFQIITHMFMHADMQHIFFNMLGLVFFGTALEALWGPKRFLFFYLACGLGAAALYTLVHYIELQALMSKISPEKLQLLGDESKDMLYRNVKVFKDDTLQKANAIIHGWARGASGAVFGVLAGYAFKFPNNTVSLIFPPISMKAKYMALIYGVMELSLGMGSINTGIAHFAHIGGAICGILLILHWQKWRF